MIIHQNYSGKIRAGFSLVEIIVSVFILLLIGLGIFSIYNTISSHNDFVRDKEVLYYFSDYISDVVRKVDIPENFHTKEMPFYLNQKENDIIEVTSNPLFLNTAAGFSLENFTDNILFTHQIYFVQTDIIEGIVYHHYKIEVSYKGEKNIFYITK